MAGTYNIKDLLAVAFDINLPVQLSDAEASPSDGTVSQYYPQVTVMNEVDETDYKISWMGTPILFPMEFSAEGLDRPYKVYRNDGRLEEINIRSFMLPAATVADFTRAKKIITTEVLGGDGTIKELYGFDDWNIRIRGVCLDDAARSHASTATEQKRELLKWENIAGAVKVNGSLFKEKDITEIVIQSIHIRQLEGKPWAIPFEISAVSNQPVSLILNEI